MNRNIVQRTRKDSEAGRMEIGECITLSGDELTHDEEIVLKEDEERMMELKSESNRLELINQSQVESIERMNSKLARQRNMLREIKTKIHDKKEELRKIDEELDDFMEDIEQWEEIQERKKELLGAETEIKREELSVNYTKLRFSKEISKLVKINENLKQASEEEKINCVTREQHARDEHDEKTKILKDNINDAIREKTKNIAKMNLLRKTEISLLDHLDEAKGITQKLKDQNNKKDIEIDELRQNMDEMKRQFEDMKNQAFLSSNLRKTNTEVKNLKRPLLTELENPETCDNLINSKKCYTKVMCSAAKGSENSDFVQNSDQMLQMVRKWSEN